MRWHKHRAESDSGAYSPRPEHSSPPAPLGQSIVSLISVKPLPSVADEPPLSGRGGRVPRPPKYALTASGSCAKGTSPSTQESQPERRFRGAHDPVTPKCCQKAGCNCFSGVREPPQRHAVVAVRYRQQLLHLDLCWRQRRRRRRACTMSRHTTTSAGVRRVPDAISLTSSTYSSIDYGRRTP